MNTAVLQEPLATATGLQQEERVLSRWPEWFEEERRRARDEFEKTPAPSRREEAWRYSDLAALDLSGFHPAPPVSSPHALLAASRGTGRCSARIVIANNRLLAVERISLPKGVLVLPLQDAAASHPDLFRQYFMAQPVELGSHKYAALHQAQVETGAFVFVPKGMTVAEPIEIFHWAEGDTPSLFPHTLVVLEDDASAAVLDVFRSADNRRALACGVNDLHVGPRASLTYVALQDWSRDSLAFHLNSTVVASGGSSTTLMINFGGGYVRGESYSRLTGPHARSEMLAVSPLDGHRQVDLRTLQDHAAPQASSDLLYLNSLDDSARSIFSGLIRVREGAHRTDAYQKVRNLLLSDSAEANSMPGLEILADDVRCTHGATSGEISPEELFYLETRGIPRSFGRRLIVNGFFQTAIGRLKDPFLQTWLADLIAHKLGIPRA